jgi:DNA segregation ATPase FtsK/SpoIIIE, S-DNA-T family
VDMVLGDGARERGALADEIPGDEAHAGIGFVIDTGSRLPVRFRAGWVTDGDIDDLAARCAPRPATTDTTATADAADAEQGDGDVVPFPHTTPRPSKEDAS